MEVVMILEAEFGRPPRPASLTLLPLVHCIARELLEVICIAGNSFRNDRFNGVGRLRLESRSLALLITLK